MEQHSGSHGFILGTRLHDWRTYTDWTKRGRERLREHEVWSPGPNRFGLVIGGISFHFLCPLVKLESVVRRNRIMMSTLSSEKTSRYLLPTPTRTGPGAEALYGCLCSVEEQ